MNIIKYCFRLLKYELSDIFSRVPFIFLIGVLLGFIIAYMVFVSIGIKNFVHCSYGDSIITNPVAQGHRKTEKQAYSYFDAESLDDITISVEMASKVRVLCWVLTCPKNHNTRAIHVKMTWGHRCNKLLFMSSAYDKTLPTVKLPVKEGRDYLWGKTKAAFRYVYKHHRNDADWFFKADDDTYTIVENLRFLLSSYNSRELLYFGFRFAPYTKQGYMSGGAGYVLSRGALDVLYKDGLNGRKMCEASDDRQEDVELGICLDKLGVKAMDTRDAHKRGRFFPFNAEYHFFPSHDGSWYWKYNYYNTTDGLKCCSDYAITFHYVTPQQMYVYDYFVYRLRPYGIKFNMGEPVHGIIIEDLSQEFMKNESVKTKPIHGTIVQDRQNMKSIKNETVKTITITTELITTTKLVTSTKKKTVKIDKRKGMYVPYFKDRNMIPYTHFYALHKN